MAQKKRKSARKDQIIRAAERIFAQKGFHKATISEIAKEARVSDATIYEYFPTKEELLFSIPLDVSRASNQNFPIRLELIKGAANRLRAIIYSYFSFYENRPDYAAVIFTILKTNREFLQHKAYEEFRKLSRHIIDVVREGIASGEFKPDTDPYLVRTAVLGSIEHSVISKLLLGRPKKLVQLTDPITDMIVGGIDNRRHQNELNFRVILEPITKNEQLASPQGTKIKNEVDTP